MLELISGRPPRRSLFRADVSVGDADPYGLDLQLALYVCYELHYRGFAGVDPRWEWNPGLLHVRAALEERFEDALLREVGHPDESETAVAEMAALAVEPVDGEGLSYFLRDEGTWDQMREYFVHRSLHHLNEGDLHARLRPALAGPAKTGLLRAAGLDSTYLAHLDHLPAESLVVVNLMSLFVLHRVWRGAAAGHFASAEITSPPGCLRLAQALQRLGAPASCVQFYAGHGEADAVRARAVGADVVGDLLCAEPHLDRDVVFGIRARHLVEERLSAHMMKSWVSGRNSLRRPLV